jgi:hypothetical protein
MPSSSEIVAALDASFALRHVKSSHGKFLSVLLTQANTNTRKQLKHVEPILFQTQDVLET